MSDMFQPILCQKSKCLERSISRCFYRFIDLAPAPKPCSGFSQPHSATMAAFLEHLLPWAVCLERNCCLHARAENLSLQPSSSTSFSCSLPALWS